MMRLNTVAKFSILNVVSILVASSLAFFVSSCKSSARQNSSSAKEVTASNGIHTYASGKRNLDDNINGQLKSAVFVEGTTVEKGSVGPDGIRKLNNTSMPCKWYEKDNRDLCNVGHLTADLTFVIDDASKPAQIDVNVELINATFNNATQLDVSSGQSANDFRFHQMGFILPDPRFPTFQFRADFLQPLSSIPESKEVTVRVTLQGFTVSAVKMKDRAFFEGTPKLSIKRNFMNVGDDQVNIRNLDTYAATVTLDPAK